MRRKFIHIFTITLLSLCWVGLQAYAQQDSEGLPVRSENTEKDTVSTKCCCACSGRLEDTELEENTISTDEPVTEASRADMLAPNPATPAKVSNVLLAESEVDTPKPSTKSTPTTSRQKEAENAPKLRFNLLHYLFYKVKVGAASSN